MNRAVILAGGRGTRLHPFTITLPKPLVPIGDQPILEIVIRQLIACGFSHVTLAVNHQAEIIRAYFGDGGRWNIKIDYSLEKKPLSTMAPLRLIPDLPDDFLVMNGDVLTDLAFDRFLDEHSRGEQLFTISAAAREQTIDYGVLQTGADGYLAGFEEKPKIPYCVSMGVYCVNKKVLDFIPEGQSFGFDQLMLKMIADRQRVRIVVHDGYWLDIGRPDDYQKALEDWPILRTKLKGMTVMRSLDIVCPVFREEEMIALFHRQLSAALEPLDQRYRIRIIYVLDPSPDKTEALLCSISATDPRVEVLVMSRRFGHQAALIAGIDCSRGDAVVMLDSDMQHPPELIPQLVDHWEHGADVVQMIRQDGSETRLAKRLTSRWFYHLLQKVGAVDLPAGASDYRLLSQRVAAVVRAQITERNPFLRGLVSWVGFNIVHLPFKPSPRQGGRSHYRSSTLINFALNGICSFSKLPLRFCVGLGMAIAFLSFLAGFLEIIFYMLGAIEVPGWSSLIAAVCFLSGVQLFFLGVIGEYIGLIFDEVKGRPRYIADRRYLNGRPARCEGAERTLAAPMTQVDTVADERVEPL